MDNAYQHSTIAQILENILEQFTFEGESRSNIADILLSILNKTEYNEDPHSVIGDLLIRLKAKIEGESYDPYDAAYTSRIAEILISILEETEYTEEPQSRIAELLLQLKEELEAYTELTASGSVASFITNVVKPLVNGEFTIQAYQEGSGDPSPSNVRNIVSFRALNITKTGKNLYNDERTFANPSSISSQNVKRLFTPNTYCLGMSSNNYMAGTLPPPSISNVIVGNGSISFDVSSIQGGTAYLTLCCPVYNLKVGETYFVSGTRTQCDIYVTFYKKDGTYISYTSQPNRPFIVPQNTDFAVIIFRAGNVGTVKVENIQLELGSTATAYEPYVTPEVKTVDLGEDVYGGSYNSVSGKKIVNKKALVFTGNEAWLFNSATQFFYTSFYGLDIVGANSIVCTNGIKITLYANGICRIYISDNSQYIDSTTDMNTIMVNGIKALYNTTPIETDLEPVTIETFDGSNNIFCDTGDTSVTYLYKGTPPETLTRVLSKSPDVEDIIKEEKLEDLKVVDELQDLDISDKEVK